MSASADTRRTTKTKMTTEQRKTRHILGSAVKTSFERKRSVTVHLFRV